jgi:hypothetical protein
LAVWSVPTTKERPVDGSVTQIDSAFRAASAALWTAAIAMGVAAIGKIALYWSFRRSAFDACDAAVDLEPDGGWSDASFPCEQFAPMGWILPYAIMMTVYAVFTVMFAVAAVKAGRWRPGARPFALVTAILAVVLCVIPGLFDLDWMFAIATANQADTLVAQRIRDDVPGWFAVLEIITLTVVLVASVRAVFLLRHTKSEVDTARRA